MQKLLQIIDQVMENKSSFLAAFFFVFTSTYGFLYAVDFYPEPIKVSASSEVSRPLGPLSTSTFAKSTENKAISAVSQTVNNTTANKNDEVSESEKGDSIDTSDIGSDTLPTKLTIDALDRTVAVLNPASKTVASLDAALLKGVVRHPDSATFAEDGNMFILGHSSYLPTVHNRNFQALNGIQNLKWGDTIKLSSASAEYTYKIEKVYKAKASAMTVPVSGKGKTLTIATCNSFGSTDDRYIIEATMVSKKAL